MQTTLFLVLLPALAMAVHPDRHVRVAQQGEPVRMSVQSDGAVLKVSEQEPAAKPELHDEDESTEGIDQQDVIEQIIQAPPKKAESAKQLATDAGEKKADVSLHTGEGAKADSKADTKTEEKEVEAVAKETKVGKVEALAKETKVDIKPVTKVDTKVEKKAEVDTKAEKKAEVSLHSADGAKAPKVEAKTNQKEIEALAKETKVHHEAAPVQAGEVRAHQASKARPKPSEGVSLAQDPAGDETQTQGEESEQSWKSAFFFFASLVLIAVLAVGVIGIFYFNRDQSQKTDGGETVGLKATSSKAGQYINDSSSTSDSGEKIAMLFDRVRQSLEDLSDKSAQQADVAGGQAQGQNTI
jgi:hypothetical protein